MVRPIISSIVGFYEKRFSSTEDCKIDSTIDWVSALRLPPLSWTSALI